MNLDKGSLAIGFMLGMLFIVTIMYLITGFGYAEVIKIEH